MVELEREGGVARIFLNRPQKVNALDSPLLDALASTVGSGRAAWLVLTGEAIDAQRAYEWGLVETLCPAAQLDQTVAATVQLLLAGERDALRLQKELLQMWEEQPLSQSIAVSVERFSQAYAARNTISRAKTPGKH